MHAIFSPRFVLWLVEQIRILFELNIDTKKNFHFNRYLPASVLMVRRNRASLLRTNYTWLWVFCASKLLSFLWANDLLFKEMMNAGRGASHWELVRLSFRLFFRNEKNSIKVEWKLTWMSFSVVLEDRGSCWGKLAGTISDSEKASKQCR